MILCKLASGPRRRSVFVRSPAAVKNNAAEIARRALLNALPML